MISHSGSSPLLRVTNLRIDELAEGLASTTTTIINGVSFDVPRGKVTAIVGESGRGKTLTASAVMGLLPDQRLHIHGESSICFEGRELVGCAEEVLHSHRGRGIAMIFQEPGSCLNPVITIGEQLCLPILKHTAMTKNEAHEQAIQLLTEVGISSPEERLRSFQHELSGGQLQRVMIAMALACEPKFNRGPARPVHFSRFGSRSIHGSSGSRHERGGNRRTRLRFGGVLCPGPCLYNLSCGHADAGCDAFVSQTSQIRSRSSQPGRFGWDRNSL